MASADHITRERLITTAMELIQKLPLDQVTSARVLEESGISKGSLYHFFADFNDLIEQALLKQFAEGVQETINQAAQLVTSTKSAQELRESLHRLTSWSQSKSRQQVRMRRARLVSMTSDNPRFAQALGEVQQQLTDALTELFAKAQTMGWMRQDFSPRAAAVLIQAYTLGRVVDDVSLESLDEDEWTNMVVLVIDRTFF